MKALTLLLSVVTLSLLVLPHYVDAAYWDDVVDQDTAQGGTDTQKKARMILAHVILMLIAWTLLMPLATLVVRMNSSTSIRSAFSFHAFFHILAWVCSLTAIVLAIIVVARQRGAPGAPVKHFATSHGKVGGAIFSCSLAQMVLGSYTRAKGHKTTLGRVAKWGHRIHGLALLGLGFWCTITGFQDWGMPNVVYTAIYVYMGFLGGLYVMPIVLNALRSREEKRDRDWGLTPFTHVHPESGGAATSTGNRESTGTLTSLLPESKHTSKAPSTRFSKAPDTKTVATEEDAPWIESVYKKGDGYGGGPGFF